MAEFLFSSYPQGKFIPLTGEWLANDPVDMEHVHRIHFGDLINDPVITFQMTDGRESVWQYNSNADWGVDRSKIIDLMIDEAQG